MANSRMTAFKVWRGERGQGGFKDYETECSEGMVVLDAIHQIQADQANDLAVRWNCKAGKCGSCSAEVNGMPKLMCMTRLTARGTWNSATWTGCSSSASTSGATCARTCATCCATTKSTPSSSAR